MSHTKFFGPFTTALLACALLISCTDNKGQSSTVVEPGQTQNPAIGQVGSPGSTRVEDANTTGDANATDDLGQANGTDQDKDASMSSTTERDENYLMKAAPRISTGSKEGSGTGMKNQGPQGSVKDPEQK